MKVAIIHDWLVSMRGGEHCLEVLCTMFPDADVFTLFLDEEAMSPLILQRPINVSPLGRLPGVKSYYRFLLPLYPLAAKLLSAKLEREHAHKEYDLIISVSHCAAKNVRVPEDVPHICYCLTPVRYLWDQYDRYFSGKVFEPIIRPIAAILRRWDIKGATNVDNFVGISEFVAKRIERYYRRDAEVVYPPVRTDWLGPIDAAPREPDTFISVNALVPYKNTELLVRAFNELPYKLKIIGTGPEEGRLRSIAKSNIEFCGFVSQVELAAQYRKASAMVFAAEEDFGMTPVEMLASGGAVIAFGSGGVLETLDAESESPCAVFFDDLSIESIKKAVREFISRQGEFTVDNCSKRAQLFSVRRFVEAIDSVLSGHGFAVTEEARRNLGIG